MGVPPLGLYLSRRATEPLFLILTVFLSSYRDMSGHLKEREMGVGIRTVGECFSNFFEFSQTFTSVSIKQLDYELEISIA